MLRNILILFIIPLTLTNCWQLDPYCLLNKCDQAKEEVPKPQPPASLWSKYKPSKLWSKYRPHCFLFSCEDPDRKIVDEGASPKIKEDGWNPSCWFQDCPESPKQPEVINQDYWTYDYWFNKEDSRTLRNKIECIFKECPHPESPKEKKESVTKPRFIRDMFKSTVDYLNAAKPQEILINNIFTSELNPYCWMTECCNENTISGNIDKLSELIHTGLYGQHLVNTIIDAVSSHWSTQHQSRKALVLSFHGPVGTGKNYVSEMIANSLYKLGVKSRYVHYFSGRLHFTLQDSSDSYKQNLYSWLKGNITECSKQLFIFDEADHIPEHFLNSILPMLDYREKVDGADYRNAIFIFLSNAGSELILEKLDQIYQNNKTREEVEIIDFEREIIFGIFNQKGGFYHSDTISHNLIDHYIPFLPLERQHVEECIMDQFRQRNVPEPSDEHVLGILSSISWGQARKIEFSKSGCKTIGSKVAYLCEKHYKQLEKEKNDL